MYGRTLSGPAALWGLRVLKSFSSPLVEMSNSCMVSCLGSVWSEHSVWSLAGVLGLKTDWNCLFRICAFCVGLVSSLPVSGFRKEAMPIESCLLCLMKVQKRLLCFLSGRPWLSGAETVGHMISSTYAQYSLRKRFWILRCMSFSFEMFVLER